MHHRQKNHTDGSDASLGPNRTVVSCSVVKMDSSYTVTGHGPVNKRRWHSDGLMLGPCLRRWPNIAGVLLSKQVKVRSRTANW